MSYRSMENTIRQIMANSSRPAWTAVAANINEENIGGRTYNNMHLCKTAVDKFEDDLKNKNNDPQIHKAIAAVNDYLGVEARVLDKGHATEDDVKAVKAGVEKAKQAISAAGLTGHDYHGLHIRAVERKVKKEEAIDPTDTGGAEESDMGLRQVAAMRHFLDGIEERIKAQGDMEEWYQNKLTKANDYLKSLYSYGKGDAAKVDEETELQEKSVSQAQQKAAGAALAAKRGEIKPSELQGASKQMYDSMTTKELDDFASTKHKGLPVRKESVELDEATDFRPGDTVHEVGSKLKGTVQHKGNRDLIAVKFGSVNKMIPASKLRLAEEVELDETITPKHVKMAIGVASDKRYAKGNMTGAVAAIEKIKKGLSDHPQVKAVLRRQNESAELVTTRRADVGVEKTRTPDGKFIFKKEPKKEIAVEQYDRYSSVLSRAIKKKS